jgi:hypothetical protein
MRNCILFASLLCFIAAAQLSAQRLEKRVGEIKYVSQETYYINLGTQHGVSAGDSVMVKRNVSIVGMLLVEHVSRLSSACRLLSQKQPLKIGDRVEGSILVKDEKLPTEPQPVVQPAPRTAPLTSPQKKSARSQRTHNRLSGSAGIQTVWSDDRSSSNIDYRQVGLRTNLSVKQLFGMPLELRLRWRSRMHDRERIISTTIDDQNWQHNVYELGLKYENPVSGLEFGAGRILSPHVRGLGYIDGGFFSMKLAAPWRVGIAGGTEPNLRNSGFQTEDRKFGVFVNFERGEFRAQRVSSTVAFSGSYHNGTSSREFVYLQNSFWWGSKFSLYQTVEADLNRGWKRANGESAIQFSNLYFSGQATPTEILSLNFSFDARKNIRIFETRSIPDSLFDETLRKGLHSGFSLRLPQRIRFSGNFGIRLREGNFKNTTSASAALNVRQPFRTWVTVNMRIAYFSTQFTKGYRPDVNLRVPVLRNLSFDVGAGSYIYQTGALTTRSHWLDLQANTYLSRRIYANFGYRSYFDNRLKSRRFFVETGLVF